MSNVASQPDAGKLPAGPGRKKIAKTGTNALGKKEQVFEINLWSSGPNKRNEQGSGDDILYGPFETEVEKP